MYGIKKDDLRRTGQRNSVLNIFGTTERQEVDASIWRMEPFKESCNVKLMDKQPAGEEEFERDEIFDNYVAMRTLEGFRIKM